jgi:hypothetical protein
VDITRGRVFATRTVRARSSPLVEVLSRPIVREVVVPFVATRAALFAVALVTFRLPLDPAIDLSPNHLLSALGRWDGAWYVNIAQSGYDYTSDEFSAVAFSPLLPLLMRALAPVFGGGTTALLVAGALIVNAALFAACVLLVKLTALDFERSLAQRVPLYLLAFPTSFFLSAIYPESLFLALAVGAFYCARTDRWLAAGLLGALCALARPHGVVIALPLAVEYLYQRSFDVRAVRANALALMLPFVAFAGWLGYQYLKFGDALAFVHAQLAWQRVPGAPWQAFTNYFFGGERGPWNDLLFALLFIALAVIVAYTQRPSYAVYAALYVLVPLSTGQLYSMMRFGLSIFPVFIALAWLGRFQIFDRAYVPAGLMIAGAFMTFFVTQQFFLA